MMKQMNFQFPDFQPRIGDTTQGKEEGDQQEDEDDVED